MVDPEHKAVSIPDDTVEVAKAATVTGWVDVLVGLPGDRQHFLDGIDEEGDGAVVPFDQHQAALGLVGRARRAELRVEVEHGNHPVSHAGDPEHARGSASKGRNREHRQDFVHGVDIQGVISFADTKEDKLARYLQQRNVGHGHHPGRNCRDHRPGRTGLERLERDCYHRPVAFTEAAAARLEAIGFRSTAPRRAVLKAIERAPGPFTVEDLLGQVPGVGRATVFRTIKLLQELDLLCRVPLEDGSARYQLSEGTHHHHLVCRSCGRFTEFSDPEIDARIQEQAALHGFRLQGHSLELYGHCAECVKQGLAGQ